MTRNDPDPSSFQMRIPLEHFCATPVFALSPAVHDNNHNFKSNNSNNNSSSNNPSVRYPSLVNNNGVNHCKEKKMSLPNSLGLLSLQSAGSAPSSPGTSRRNPDSGVDSSGLPTVSGIVGFAAGTANFDGGPVSLPVSAAVISRNPYATLPKK